MKVASLYLVLLGALAVALSFESNNFLSFILAPLGGYLIGLGLSEILHNT
jgi:hypothetical protein